MHYALPQPTNSRYRNTLDLCGFQWAYLVFLTTAWFWVSFSAAIQFYAGVITISAVWKMRRTARSKTITFLLCHMLTLQLTNTTGCVTAIIGFVWCLGTLQALYDPSNIRLWHPGWFMLYLSSNLAFILSGLLTDGILVSHITIVLVLSSYTLSYRYGVSELSVKQHYIKD